VKAPAVDGDHPDVQFAQNDLEVAGLDRLRPGRRDHHVRAVVASGGVPGGRTRERLVHGLDQRRGGAIHP